MLLAGCSGGGSGIDTQKLLSPNGNAYQGELAIINSAQLIGGPAAQGRVGDILLQNDKIRIVVQQPGKYPGISSFGGNIIDADHVRPAGQPGNDNFGSMVPLLNVEWTTNTVSAEVLSSGAGKPQVVRTHAIIDTYDYLDVDFLEPIAKSLAKVSLYFSPQFDDMNNPFAIFDLQHIDVNVTTDYRLDPGQRYVKITTTLHNKGEQAVSLPVGDFLNGSGQVQLLIPGQGFSPTLMKQIQADTPAVFFVGMPGIDVSYGYFYDFHQFLDPSKKEITRLKSASLSYSGVTGVMLGEEFVKLFPIGGGRNSSVNFSVPAGQSRDIVRYLVVGDGSASSLLDQGLEILKLPNHQLSGIVIDPQGQPVAGATVAVFNSDGGTVATYTSTANGLFSGNLSTGETNFAQAFGSGQYQLTVFKQGYALPKSAAETNMSGACTPDKADLRSGDVGNIYCTLGNVGSVQIEGGVLDTETQQLTPARLTIVGFDGGVDTSKIGRFNDPAIFDMPYGIVDVKLINAKGGIGLSDSTSFQLSPGTYIFSFSHGPEYSIDNREVTVSGGAPTVISGVKVKRVVKTPGLIGADFHVHAIRSPDSVVPMEQRALSAVAEGLDVLHSSDHDYLVDYAPVVRQLVRAGMLLPDSLQTIVGDEISPNNLGHIHVFPLVVDPLAPNGGALDWSLSALDTVSPAPDYTMTVRDIIDAARHAPGPAEKVIQINHIADSPTSIPIVAGWVTTIVYQEGFGVKPLSTYADPAAQRLPAAGGANFPLSLEQSPMIGTNFDAVELAIGAELSHNHLLDSALPVWFNLLNLGILATATANSDSHTEFSLPLGLPRNYIQSATDPRDGLGTTFEAIDPEHYARPINQHHLVISAGPIITMTAEGEDGVTGQVGDVVTGHRIKLHIEVHAASWAWFDTIEIYANTEPIPADDDGVTPLKGVASDPKSFFASYHLPKFTYQPTQIFRLSDGTLKNWKEENGQITATLDLTVQCKRDTWVVALARGTRDTKGYKSLFPYAPRAVKDPEKLPEIAAPFTLDSFHQNPGMDAPAWALTNPIFIDTDGDTNGDGKLFEALYIQLGLSPLAKQ